MSRVWEWLPVVVRSGRRVRLVRPRDSDPFTVEAVGSSGFFRGLSGPVVARSRQQVPTNWALDDAAQPTDWTIPDLPARKVLSACSGEGGSSHS